MCNSRTYPFFVLRPMTDSFFRLSHCFYNESTTSCAHTREHKYLERAEDSASRTMSWFANYLQQQWMIPLALRKSTRIGRVLLVLRTCELLLWTWTSWQVHRRQLRRQGVLQRIKTLLITPITIFLDTLIGEEGLSDTRRQEKTFQQSFIASSRMLIIPILLAGW